jgi:hypothetical protein
VRGERETFRDSFDHSSASCSQHPRLPHCVLLAFLDGGGDWSIIDEHPKDEGVVLVMTLALPRSTNTDRMRVVGRLTFKSTRPSISSEELLGSSRVRSILSGRSARHNDDRSETQSQRERKSSCPDPGQSSCTPTHCWMQDRKLANCSRPRMEDVLTNFADGQLDVDLGR